MHLPKYTYVCIYYATYVCMYVHTSLCNFLFNLHRCDYFNELIFLLTHSFAIFVHAIFPLTCTWLFFLIKASLKIYNYIFGFVLLVAAAVFG